ncbi:HipA domain-containing protein [Cereibacter azotoformans]|uniref:HipA domain-containing protein n=1 Tax=Cereibacter azotoformans TaxID=43057 RepID=UPI000C6DD645|nr:HipA domain-containing protein [Cereibacter azotoformans]
MGRPPVVRRLDVRINGRLAGEYRFTPAGGVSFAYDAGWLAWEFAFPISRQLPLRSGAQSGTHVNAVFENLLPDNPDLRRRIAERAEARSDRPHDLLAAIGRDCIGAMQFLPHGADPGDPFRVDGVPQAEAQIAAAIRDLAEWPLGIRAEDPFRISLAGAQEKTAFLWKDDTWLKPAGLTPTTHIFKRRMGIVSHGIDMTDSVENEWLCLKLAAALGLPVNEARIETFEDQTVLVVTRFDRTPRAKGGILRLPQEDFLQALGFESGQKYQEHGGPGMQDGLRLLEGSSERAADQLLFLKAQIVNWILAAIDGHAKNYSLFLGPGGFRMTPLYDIVSAAPAMANGAFRNRELRLAMPVGRRRHYRLDQIRPRHFEETSDRARVPSDIRRRAFVDLVETGLAAFEEVANALPAGFPDRVAGPIIDHARDRMSLLTARCGAGLIEGP